MSCIAGNKPEHDESIALVKVKSVANDISESKNIHGIHGIYIGYTEYYTHGICIVYNIHCVYG